MPEFSIVRRPKLYFKPTVNTESAQKIVELNEKLKQAESRLLVLEQLLRIA
jgi:hypothetical protein